MLFLSRVSLRVLYLVLSSLFSLVTHFWISDLPLSELPLAPSVFVSWTYQRLAKEFRGLIRREQMPKLIERLDGSASPLLPAGRILFRFFIWSR